MNGRNETNPKKKKKRNLLVREGERQNSIQSANEALIVSKGGLQPVQPAVGIHYNKSLSRHILHRRLLGLAGRLLFLFPSYRVTIVVITIIIIAYCLGWEDFVLLRVSRGNKLEREREKNELTSAEEQQMARKLLRL